MRDFSRLACTEGLDDVADKCLQEHPRALVSVGASTAVHSICFACYGVSLAQRAIKCISKLVVQQSCCALGQGLGLSSELKGAIDKFIQDNKIVLFMKGNRMFPQCGFSNTCVQVT